MAMKLPTIKSLRDGSPWDIAKKFGVQYTGDTNPIPHGGTWYETGNWVPYGYANGIRITESEGHLWVETVTINKPQTAAELQKCLESGGIPELIASDQFEKITPEMEIEATLGYWGADVDSAGEFTSDGGHDYDDFPEFRIMQAVRNYWHTLYGC